MRKVSLFIGFQSEGEPQKDEQLAKLTQFLEEQDKRNRRLSILLFVASIVVNTVISTVITIVLHLFGH